MKEKIIGKWASFSKTEKIMVIGLTISLLMFFIAIVFGSVMSIILAFIQIVLLAITTLIKKELVKPKNENLQKIMPIIAVIIVFPYLLFFSIGSKSEKAETHNEIQDWSTVIMSSELPAFPSNTGEIYLNTNTDFSAKLLNISPAIYAEYVVACKGKGFTVESVQSDSEYMAYNMNGYKLELDYYANEGRMGVDLEAPMQMSQINISMSEYGKILPLPKSTLGKIEKDDKTGLDVYIGEMSIDDYNFYIEECNKKGFNIGIERTEKSYIAKNAESYALSVEYIGNSIVYISVKEPEFDVEIKIECRENWFFSTYDVDIYANDELVGTVEHGTTETFNEVMKKGECFLCFKSAEDSQVTGEIKFDIDDDKKLEFSIWCYSDSINIDVVSGLEEESEVETESETTEDYESETEEIVEETETEAEIEEIEETEKITVDNSRKVYTTPYGEKYHYSRDCAGKNAIEKTENSVSGWYDPCKKCAS